MNRQDVVLIHTRLALQHPLQLCKYGLLRCPVAEKTPLHWRFSWMVVLSRSSKFAYYISFIVLPLGKKSNIITPFASQKSVVITFPVDGCVLNFFGLGDPVHTY